MFGALKRVWMPCLIVVVVAIGGFTVYRVRGYFGAHGTGGSAQVFEDTKPFHPKVVIYDICLGLGSTPPLKYDLLTEYGHIILSGIFVTSSTAGIAQAYFSRRN